MEKREDALREALANNAAEVARWDAYLQDNQQAIENLEHFSKHLTVDVMVPVGRKAFTAGQLIHSNEVMVGHYQGYFSKCAVHTAKQICEHRIRMARETLEKLTTEAEMWQNKLERPYLDGVIPCADQREIIEDYDEERERIWREEHKVRVRQAKLREKQELDAEMRAISRRESKLAKQKFNEDIEEIEDVTQMLEDAELEENFKAELENLELEGAGDTEEILKKLMSGEIQLPPSKPRVALTPKDSEVKFPNMLPGVVKKTQLKNNYTQPTNNNFRVNPELLIADNDGNETDDSDNSESPQEVKIIEEQAKFLPTSDRIGFYQYQLQIIEQKLLASTVATATDIEHKLGLFKVREHLEELMEQAEEAEGAAELAASVEIAEAEDVEIQSLKKPQKKRISFSLQNHTLEFNQNETVAEMLPKPETPPPTATRDIIRLDDTLLRTELMPKPPPASPTVDKKQRIIDKVEENFKHVTEQQSTQDFDLINKIIGKAEGHARTLHIPFKHSTQIATKVGTHEAATTTTISSDSQIPGSPADLYELFGRRANEELPEEEPTTLFIDAYEGEDRVKVPVLKEQDRKMAYKDLRMEFSNPIAASKALDSRSVQSQGSATQSIITKSILRTTNTAVESKAVNIENEMNKANANTQKKNIKPTKQKPNDDGYMSAYDKVMHDVVEKPFTEPEPLPNGKYIDALAPKKRISRFKQIRSGVEQT